MLDKTIKDYTILTTEQLAKRFASLLGFVSLFISAIAGISLINAIIGIMNTMYMVITERISEIGILRAIGAKKRDILFLFLFESGFLSLVGGIVGIAISTIIALITIIVFKSMGFKAIFYINPLIVLGLLVLSFVVGIIAGLLPSKKASELEPVKALRRV